jgi:uncharacterized Zn finger protein (UPF0148 family)
MKRLPTTSLLASGFLRQSCTEMLARECPGCGGPLAQGDLECPTCGYTGDGRARCNRCGAIVAESTATMRQCGSVHAYESDPTKPPAFAPNETLWEVQNGRSSDVFLLGESDLRQRLASRALPRTIRIREALKFGEFVIAHELAGFPEARDRLESTREASTERTERRPPADVRARIWSRLIFSLSIVKGRLWSGARSACDRVRSAATHLRRGTAIKGLGKLWRSHRYEIGGILIATGLIVLVMIGVSVFRAWVMPEPESRGPINPSVGGHPDFQTTGDGWSAFVRVILQPFQWIWDVLVWIFREIAFLFERLWGGVVWLFEALASIVVATWKALVWTVEKIGVVFRILWDVLGWIFSGLVFVLKVFWDVIVWIFYALPEILDGAWQAVLWLAEVLWLIIKYVFIAIVAALILLWELIVWIFS